MTHPNPFFTDEHQLFQDSVRKFVNKEAPREKVRRWDRDKQYPYELYEKMADLGWMQIGIPEDLGGNGLDVKYLAILCEELSRWSSDLGGMYFMSHLGALNVVTWGTDSQKKDFLPGYMAGKRRFSFSMTEPNTGSESFGLTTFAADNGDHFVVNGEKIFATAADKTSNIIVLAARTRKTENKREGISVFLVPNDIPGLEIQRLDLLARRIAGTTRLIFTDAKIPKSALLGELHQGVSVLRWHLVIERVLMSACYMGNAQGTVDVALQYAKERHQFGKPIATFQAIAHMLADMHTDVEASRQLVWRAAWLLARGVDCFQEASVAKLHSSETSFKVAALGMQILGGYAQMPEFDMERFFRDSKNSMVGGGTSQIQRTLIAQTLGIRIPIA